MSQYRSNIKLGERYRDTATGFEGVATVVSFFQYGCERATLKGMNRQGEIVEYGFDAAELEVVRTGEKMTLAEAKTGGPHGSETVVRSHGDRFVGVLRDPSPGGR